MLRNVISVTNHELLGHYSKPFKLLANLVSPIFLQLLLLIFICTSANEESLFNDIQTLSTSLPGVYDKVSQYYKPPQKKLPSNKRNHLTRSEIYKMTSPMFNDSFTLYFQDFAKSRLQPVRSGFYSVSVDLKQEVIRMRTFHLKYGAFVVNALKRAQHFIISNDVLEGQGLATSQMESISACDMFWKRLVSNTLVAITGPLCLGSLGPNQVRIGVSMSLTRDKLLLTEGWYSLSDGIHLMESTISYTLQKQQEGPTPSIGRSMARRSGQDKAANEIVYPDEIPNSRLSSEPFWNKNGIIFADRFRDEKRERRQYVNIVQRKSERTIRKMVLRDFRQVSAALTSNYIVHYRINLSMCLSPDYVKVEMSPFGGKIKNFVIVAQDGSKNEAGSYIYFLSQTIVMRNEGPELIIRNVTLQKDGGVKVKVLNIISDSPWTKKESNFECRLHNIRNGPGGVKLTLKPANQIKTIKNMRTPRTSFVDGYDGFADLARWHSSR